MHKRLFWPTLTLYPLFLYAVDQGYGGPACITILAIYALWLRHRMLEIDWALLLLFVMLFLNLGLLTHLEPMTRLAAWLVQLPGGEITAGILLSQMISNVPATLFLESFTDDWQRLAWGVNIGGFGLAIGSLANLIALRLARQAGLLTSFHLWSIPCLLLCFGIILLW